MKEDLYNKVLDIPEGERPPDYYTLLGLEIFEADQKLIHKAGLSRIKKLKEWELHRDTEVFAFIQKMLNMVSNACVVIKNTEKKRQYDEQLSAKLNIEPRRVEDAQVSEQIKKEELEERDRQISENVCPVCSFNNSHEAKFCGSCGAVINRDCPECSTNLSIHIQFCTNCGTDIDSFLRAEKTLEMFAELEFMCDWPRIISEYNIVLTSIKLSGKNGKALLNKLKIYNETAVSNLNKSAELKKEANKAIEDKAPTQSHKYLKEYLDLNPNDLTYQELDKEIRGDIRSSRLKKLKKVTVITGISIIAALISFFTALSFKKQSQSRKTYRELMTKADSCLAENKFSEAVTVYRKILSLSGCENDAKVKKAIVDIQSQIDRINALNEKGLTFLDKKDWANVVLTYQKLLKMPGQENNEQAKAGLTQGKEMLEIYRTKLQEAEEALLNKDFFKAQNTFEQILKIPGYEEDEKARDGLGKVKERVDRISKNLTDIKSLIENKRWQDANNKLNKIINSSNAESRKDFLKMKARLYDQYRKEVFNKLVLFLLQFDYQNAEQLALSSIDEKLSVHIKKLVKNLKRIIVSPFAKIDRQAKAVYCFCENFKYRAFQKAEQYLPETGVLAKYFKKYLPRTFLSYDLTMVPVLPGKFIMGAKDADSDEKPPHQVEVSRFFWISENEITIEQFKAVMEHTPNYDSGNNNSYYISDNDPVSMVSWYEAMIFCAKFTKDLKMREMLPSGYEIRLPTEAEWEYSCRAGTQTDNFFSQTNNKAVNLNSYAWYKKNSRKTIHKVSQKKPNQWKLYDIYGNVWEWCYDRYGAYSSESIKDPVVLNKGKYRVIRGGDYNSSAGNCRSANRSRRAPNNRKFGVGFRIVLAPQIKIDFDMEKYINKFPEPVEHKKAFPENKKFKF